MEYEEKTPLLKGQCDTPTESRATKRSRRRTFAIKSLLGCCLISFLPGIIIFYRIRIAGTLNAYVTENFDNRECIDSISGDGACFTPSNQRVPEGISSFPSFWNYGLGRMNVTFDGRSIIINGDRALFLSGSMHPSRATKFTWGQALDQAVENGLNMITIYIMWAQHQPFQFMEIDWSLPSGVNCSSLEDCKWSLADAIIEAANRGFFVHVRVGPYVCAEYSYGGIPEWLPLTDAALRMRRPNTLWMSAMETFVAATVKYLEQNNLFAYQGGPIVMAQIENELGGDMDTSGNDYILITENTLPNGFENNRGSFLRNASMQDYANWCGNLAQRLAPKVIWTMCFGLSAANTIETFNGMYEEASWLEKHGDSGMIQVEHPAMWTEDEGGFQIWGETPTHPSDYFWGLPASTTAYHAMRWFARGGFHLNYYMWWGGYNRGRAAAAGIMNIYASDAALCPSGHPREPKFSHLKRLHLALASVAQTILGSASAVNKGQKLYVLDEKGQWVIGEKQLLFSYKSKVDPEEDVLFVENGDSTPRRLRVPNRGVLPATILFMSPYSAVILSEGNVIFNSSNIDKKAQSFERSVRASDSKLLWHATWCETVGVSTQMSGSVSGASPEEQTKLNVARNISSDYAWYETDVYIPSPTNEMKVIVDTAEANAILVFFDGTFVGSADTHAHADGDVALKVSISGVQEGHHTMAVLSESLGYSNLIGRWGANTEAKKKGIIGNVTITLAGNTTLSLVDGREWRSFPGLHSIRIPSTPAGSASLGSLCGGCTPTWSVFSFSTPSYEPIQEGLFVDIVAGRGHLWLNGRDLGRYWNITRNGTSTYAQRYYFLPPDYLLKDGRNELLLFDVYGGSHSDTALVQSKVTTSSLPNFRDEVDYPGACTY